MSLSIFGCRAWWLIYLGYICIHEVLFIKAFTEWNIIIRSLFLPKTKLLGFLGFSRLDHYSSSQGFRRGKDKGFFLNEKKTLSAVWACTRDYFFWKMEPYTVIFGDTTPQSSASTLFWFNRTCHRSIFLSLFLRHSYQCFRHSPLAVIPSWHPPVWKRHVKILN